MQSKLALVTDGEVMTKEEMQLIWDKALIDGWRRDFLIAAVLYRFEEQVGKKVFDCDLLRVPNLGMPFYVSVRVFVAQRLEKISNRLWDQPVERDKALIDKLQTSKYTTSTTNTNPDNELRNEQLRLKNNVARNRRNAAMVANRNHSTDWNVVK
jgi:hypothetical protein